jgi:predicted GH43/DUF377 family glycosyl hydrolase
MTRFLFFGFFVLVMAACSAPDPEVYLFSYFQGNGEDGLHLASSEDGLHWTALNDNKSYLTPTAGKDKLMRDPCIIQGGDGQFHMVWTVSWNEQGIGYAHSEDLKNWSEQRYIPVMEHEAGARNCWAPELFYDEAEDLYLIYWATTIPGRFPETDSTGDNGYNHRMYYTTTKDFITFRPTELLYDDGFNVIDATIQKVDDQYVMFLKNEIKHPEAEKNIRIATSDHLLGPYTSASEPITDNWVEGPTAIKTDQGWVVYFDRYTNHKMGAVRSTDLKNWTDISEEVQFPEGTRHGTVLKVKKKLVDNL